MLYLDLRRKGLFTESRRRGILRSSDSGSCIDPPPRAPRMASKALHAAWRRSTSCGGGWICRETNAPVIVITLASFLCILLPHTPVYIRKGRRRDGENDGPSTSGLHWAVVGSLPPPADRCPDEVDCLRAGAAGHPPGPRAAATYLIG
jgi:hypothetical protein